MKNILFFIMLSYPVIGVSQPTGKEYEIYQLINEARTNPDIFLAKYENRIEEYEPKLTLLLKKSLPIENAIWDEDLAENCKQKVYGNLNPVYAGDNKMCGWSSGNGSGYFNQDALYFICDSYIHIMNEEYKYFGFYIDLQGHAFSWGSTCETRKYDFTFMGTIDSSMVDFKNISTALNEDGLTIMDKEMIKEINFVRQYPEIYASIVATYLEERSHSIWGISKDENDAGIELIEELKAMESAQILYPKKCVYQAAKKHGEDCKKRGFFDHTGSDGSSPFSRMSKSCIGLKGGGENIVGGRKNTRKLVIQLLIDAGISDRGHRYNMLNPNWEYIGCYGYEGDGMYNYIQNFAMD